MAQSRQKAFPWSKLLVKKGFLQNIFLQWEDSKEQKIVLIYLITQTHPTDLHYFFPKASFGPHYFAPTGKITTRKPILEGSLKNTEHLPSMAVL